MAGAHSSAGGEVSLTAGGIPKPKLSEVFIERLKVGVAVECRADQSHVHAPKGREVPCPR